MPNRIIRDSILASEPVCALDWAGEVFYRRLMSIVDDYGRYEALPQLLRSRLYPLQVDQVRVADISRWMAACQKAGVIVLYEVDGKQYLQVEKFRQQLRTDSKFPAPPSAASKGNQLLANEHLGVSVSVVVSDQEHVGSAAPTRRADRFDEFWASYPRNEGKKKARATWKAKRLDALADVILADVAKRKAEHRTWREGVIPHATTYLNGERWEDAIDTSPPRSSNGQQKPPARSNLPSQHPRETPEETRAMWEANLRRMGKSPEAV